MSKKRRIIIVFFGALLLAPNFFYLLTHQIVQSFPDFFFGNTNSSLITWDSSNFGSNGSNQVWRAPWSLYFSLLKILHLSPQVGVAVLIVILQVVALVSFYKLTERFFSEKHIANSEFVRLTAGAFFVFNTYSLTQTSDSFLLTIPYFLIPLQLLLFAKAVEETRAIPYAVCLGVTSSLIFGINLIFGIISFLLLAAYGAWIAFFEKRGELRLMARVFAIASLTVLPLVAFWLTPLMYSSLIDQKSTHYILTSETFYNLDSSPLNVLRGLGSWSFFAGNNGVPYNAFSSFYRGSSLLFTGLLITGLAFTSSILLNKETNERWRSATIFFLLLLLVVLPLIGGSHAGWITSNLFSWAFGGIPYLTIFRNTYKFASIEMLSLAILICGAALIINDWFTKKNLRLFTVIFPFLILVAICINAFPFFVGLAFSSQNNLNDLPTYWQQASEYANRSVPSVAKIFMLPDQYFEVFNWPGGMKSLPRNLEETLISVPTIHDTCKGCGQAYTSDIVSYLYKNLDNPNTYKLLGQLGVSHILQRNDFAYQYYNVQSPEEVKAILSQEPGVKLQKSFGKLDLYQLNPADVYPMFYSPKQITVTGKISEIAQLSASTSGQKETSVLISQINKNDRLTTENSGYYKGLLDQDEVVLSKNAATDNIQLAKKGKYSVGESLNISNNYRISSKYSGGHYLINFTLVNNKPSIDGRALEQGNQNSFERDLGNFAPDSLALEINGRSFIISPKVQESIGVVSLRDGRANIQVYPINQISDNLAVNGGFENGPWESKVLNCQKTQDNAGLTMRIVSTDRSEGKAALFLSAKQDAACSYSPPISNFQPGLYYIQFDAKNVEGSPPSYCVWDGHGCVTYETVTPSKSWQTYSIVTALGANASNPSLYLYARKSNFGQTTNLYDNVKIYRLTSSGATVPISVPPHLLLNEQLNLSAGSHSFSTALSLGEINLLENGSFESGLWSDQINDCSGGRNFNQIKSSESSDSFTGAKSLELRSSGGIACISSGLTNSFSRDDLYSFSFAYKIAAGSAAQYCVWDESACIASQTIQKSDGRWHVAHALVKPAQTSRGLSVYFYANGGKSPSTVRYDDVSIQRVENSFLSGYTMSAPSPSISAASNISVQSSSQTSYTLSLKSQKSNLLVFQQSYHPGWKAYVVGSGKKYEIPEQQHIIVNGFENGWWIQPDKLPPGYKESNGKYNIRIEYWPQRLVNVGLIIAGAALVLPLLYLVWWWFRERRREIST